MQTSSRDGKVFVVQMRYSKRLTSAHSTSKIVSTDAHNSRRETKLSKVPVGRVVRSLDLMDLGINRTS